MLPSWDATGQQPCGEQIVSADNCLAQVYYGSWARPWLRDADRGRRWTARGAVVPTLRANHFAATAASYCRGGARCVATRAGRARNSARIAALPSPPQGPQQAGQQRVPSPASQLRTLPSVDSSPSCSAISSARLRSRRALTPRTFEK